MAGLNSEPVVSVITPTWHRHDTLLTRCLPSVWKQSYAAVEHVVVGDGPDPELDAKLPALRMAGPRKQWFIHLREHDPAEHWGHIARLHGLSFAAGDFITYCDDDDALRPRHCASLAAALVKNPEAGFAVSRMAARDPWGHDHEVGEGPPSLANIGTPMIMHRREILEHGTWGPASHSEDWELVNRWIHAGINYVQVDEVTCDVWPSTFYSGKALSLWQQPRYLRLPSRTSSHAIIDSQRGKDENSTLLSRIRGRSLGSAGS